jgi:hypothetical protein
VAFRAREPAIHATFTCRSPGTRRPEHDAYSTLAADYRSLATALQCIAERMSGDRDLSMAAQDEAALASPAAVATFERYVQAECELLTLLRSWITRDEAIL